MAGARACAGLRARSEPKGGRLAAVAAVLGSALALAGPAAATSLSFHIAGVAVPEDPGILANVVLAFDFDPTCSSGCTLRVDLTYQDVNGDRGLHSAAQALTGVAWDAAGSLDVSRAGSVLIAPLLVGSHAPAASAHLPDLTLDGVSGDAVTGHWAFRDDFDSALDADVPSAFDPLGRFVLASVRNLTAFGTTSRALGRHDLFPGVIARTERNPPDGIPFGIVDPDTLDLVGRRDRVLAQGSTTAFLAYDGSLTGISNVSALFGTDGVAFDRNGVLVPEPGTAGLVAMGLLGLATRARGRLRLAARGRPIASPGLRCAAPPRGLSASQRAW